MRTCEICGAEIPNKGGGPSRWCAAHREQGRREDDKERHRQAHVKTHEDQTEVLIRPLYICYAACLRAINRGETAEQALRNVEEILA